MSRRDTIVALSSGRPPAGIAVIRSSGPGANALCEAIAGMVPPPRQMVLRALRHPERGDILDRALVVRFEGPRSATGEDVVEYHCHGGRAVHEAVLRALCEAGDNVRIAAAGEFTRRALEHGVIDLIEAEGLADLLEAETEAQRRAALHQVDGGLRLQIDVWRSALIDLSAQAEAAIDYDGEAGSPDWSDLESSMRRIAAEMETWLARPRIERLKDGLRVVIAGPPNAGKSSLLNRIAGFDRAIVADIPGTTRDHLDVHLAISGIPMIVTDTAGVRETGDAIEAAGVERTASLVTGADILVWLGPATEAPNHRVRILVASKADLLPPDRIAEGLRVSSLTGEGVDTLLAEVERVASSLYPSGEEPLLNDRQADALKEVLTSLQVSGEEAILAAALRYAIRSLERLEGREGGIEATLDALFARFCLGK